MSKNTKTKQNPKTKQTNKKPKTKTIAGTKSSFSCRQVAEVWLVASVWQCELTVSLTDISDPASSARTALLAPLVCLICSVCWASSNLAASNGATGALSVSSPLDCHKSSVRSPYWLARRAPRKLTRLGRDWHWQEPFFIFCCDSITVTQTILCNPCQSVRGSWRPSKSETGLISNMIILCLHILPMFVVVPSEYAGFLP